MSSIRIYPNDVRQYANGQPKCVQAGRQPYPPFQAAYKLYIADLNRKQEIA